MLSGDTMERPMIKALLLEKDDAGFRAGVQSIDEARLPEGDVRVRVEPRDQRAPEAPRGRP